MSPEPQHPVLAALRRLPLHEAIGESWIASRLAAQLPEGECAVPHPRGGAACDVRFRHAEGAHTWIEIVEARPFASVQHCDRDQRARFEELLFEHAVRDVREKLAGHVPPCRTGFALVLGYHGAGRLSLPPGCIARFRACAGLDATGWAEHRAEPWPNPLLVHRAAQIEVVYWERALAAARGARSG